MIEGEWELLGGGITGWARNSEDSRPLWLELVSDNDIFGIALASLPEPRNCGFWLPVPQAALEESLSLKIRIANTDLYLPGKAPEKKSAPMPPIAGEILVDRGLSLSGWVLDSAYPEKKLRINAWINGVCIASTIAGERRFRPAAADRHGFTLHLPEQFADGQSHTVNLMDEKGRELPGSPFRIRSLAANAGEWLEKQKKPDKPALAAICGLLENMEERLPGFTSQSSFEAWKKAFPVPAPVSRQKFSLAAAAGGMLQNQQFCDLRRQDNSDFIFLPGNAKTLHPFALNHMVRALREHGGDIVYGDGEDDSQRPLLKPAWDREAFLARDYLGPILVTRAAWDAAGISRGEPESVARLKLLLTAPEQSIVHQPLLLYQGGAQESDPLRESAIKSWLDANYSGSAYCGGRIRYALPARPRISILIPTRDHADLLKTCLDSLETTSWPDYEIIIIDNGSVEDDALTLLAEAEKKPGICVLRRPGIFNYAHLNNDAARIATGTLLCFLNNDTQALHPEWLDELAAILLMAGNEAGTAGAKLLWPNGLVQHGGVIVGTHQLAAHVGNHWLDNEPGYMGRNQFAQQYSAVTAACMLTPRALFLDNGGFDATRFPIAFNDVDYCLRLREQGRKIFWTPHSRLAHHESASRGRDESPAASARAQREMNLFRSAWGHLEDRFYNPSLPLSAATEPFQGLAFPPRPRCPR